jgi:hypothetical protein
VLGSEIPFDAPDTRDPQHACKLLLTAAELVSLIRGLPGRAFFEDRSRHAKHGDPDGYGSHRQRKQLWGGDVARHRNERIGNERDGRHSSKMQSADCRNEQRCRPEPISPRGPQPHDPMLRRRR